MLRRWLLVSVVVSVLVGGTVAVAQLPPGGTFTDDDGNEHEGFIEAIAAEGITQGCNEEGTLYCPANPVTRGQMASFIARGFEVPATGEDFFPDDEGSVHEDNINRVAAAGIALGFDDGTFGPALSVSREQMASFLARAMGLDPVPGDVFDDVSGVHEGNINAIAAEEVTLGCDEAGTLFCPKDPVRRDQMASFLGRALDLTPTPPPPRPTTTTTTTTPPPPSDVFITIGDFFFSSADVTVPAGTQVFWTNSGEVDHTTTGSFWDSDNLDPGDSYSVTFNTAGTYDYICTIHPSMTGVVRVTG